MKLFNSIFNPFVSNGRFETNKKGHIQIATHFLNIYDFVSQGQSGTKCLDFYFEAKTLAHAESLRNDLIQLGYSIDRIMKKHEFCYFITGTTHQFTIDQHSFMQWIAQMNEVGFINDCLFDGWGIMGKLES
ncbi:MAG: hypothetical protein OEW75_15880 [Cyclobacteriaceae bacterium]|nr:hypothetical protein [Cyclobacteriaceae bacterium]